MNMIYSLGVWLIWRIVQLIKLVNPKVYQWVVSRQHQTVKANHEKTIWFHCASLGEYYQVLPTIKSLESSYEIVISFFSASGYDRISTAHQKYYLPIDLPSKAKQFISSINPCLAIFVKYEYWFNHLNILKSQNIPVVFLNTHFTKTHYFFKFYGKPFLKLISDFHFMTIDKNSKGILNDHGVQNVSIIGDTKFDQVVEQHASGKTVEIKPINSAKKIIVCGSIDKIDLDILIPVIDELKQNFSFILVPHEPSDGFRKAIYNAYPKSISYSTFSAEENFDTMYVDEFGVLKSLYKIAQLNYIGGGFGKGIHNLLESVVHLKPTIFGPNHSKFPEAMQLSKTSIGCSIGNSSELSVAIYKYTKKENFEHARIQASKFISKNTGATAKFIKTLEQLKYI